MTLATTALEEAVVGIGRVSWQRACEGRAERAADAPLVEAIARVEPRLSRASMYRAIAVYRQAEALPADLRGRLGPSRLYALLRLPDDHLEKAALARRAAAADLTVDALSREIDALLGVQPVAPAPRFGRHLQSTERAVAALEAGLDDWAPRGPEELDDRLTRVRAMRAALHTIEKRLARLR